MECIHKVSSIEEDNNLRTGFRGAISENEGVNFFSRANLRTKKALGFTSKSDCTKSSKQQTVKNPLSWELEKLTK